MRGMRAQLSAPSDCLIHVLGLLHQEKLVSAAGPFLMESRFSDEQIKIVNDLTGTKVTRAWFSNELKNLPVSLFFYRPQAYEHAPSLLTLPHHGNTFVQSTVYRSPLSSLEGAEGS